MSTEIALTIAQYPAELILRHLIAIIPLIIFIRLIAPRSYN